MHFMFFQEFLVLWNAVEEIRLFLEFWSVQWDEDFSYRSLTGAPVGHNVHTSKLWLDFCKN